MGIFNWLKKPPSAKKEFQKGLHLLRDNRWREALVPLKSAEVRLDQLSDKDKINVLIGLGIAYYAMSNTASAKKTFKKALPMAKNQEALHKFVNGLIIVIQKGETGKEAPLLVPTGELGEGLSLDALVPVEASFAKETFFKLFYKE